jgi:hypothetical protein
MDEKTLRERQTNLLNILGVIGDGIVDTLEPLNFDKREEELLKERQQARNGKITYIQRRK